MFVKKHRGKVFGAVLTTKEREAMEIEIRKDLAEHNRKNLLEIDSIVLWCLHETEGYGPKRLKRFHNTFVPALEALCSRYEMDLSEDAWLCTRKLKEYGIDIEEWNKGD